MHTRIFCIFLISIALTITACRPFAPEPRNAGIPDMPETFSLYTGESRPANRWWETYGDPELSRLVNEALAGNFGLREAWARLRQAQAQAVQTGAGTYPDLTFSGDAQLGRRKYSVDNSDTAVEDFRLGLISSYEVDLWGRVRAQEDAARLTVSASRDDLATAATTLAAEVTDRWLQIVAARMEIALLKKQLATNQTLLDLISLRFNKAMASALDVYQQKQVTQNVKAEIPVIEQTEQLLRHELAVLRGKPPGAALDIQRETLPEVTPLPATGFPADLLAVRPDVRAAGSRLRAADSQLEAARANRLPSLTLSGQARMGEGDMDLLFESWLLSLAGNLTAPILDGGRRAAEVARTRAVVDAQVAAYGAVVIKAAKEVEDALTQETKQREHIAALETVVATARQALEEAGNRYRNGLNDYLPVLTQLLSVQNLERELIHKKAGLLRIRVQLYRALGGTWTEGLVKPETGGGKNE